MPTGPTEYRVYVGNLSYQSNWQLVKDLFRTAGLDVRHVQVLEDSRSGMSKGAAIVSLGSSHEVRRAMDKLNETEVEGRNIFVREDREPYDDSKGGGKDKGSGKGGKSNPLPGSGSSWSQRGGGSDYASAKGTSSGFSGDTKGSSKGHGGKHHGEGHCIFLDNLPSSFSWKEVKDLCREHGLNPKHCDIITDPRTQVSKGRGLVQFFNEDEVDRALKMLSGVKADGRRLSPWRARESGSNGSRWEGQGAKPMPAVQGTKRPREEQAKRRLLAENLAPTVTWRGLKAFFAGYFELDYCDVVNTKGDIDQANGAKDSSEIYGILEFQSRADALEACMQFNGVLLEDYAIRLRQDRGEFDELRKSKRQRQQEGCEEHLVRPDGKKKHQEVECASDEEQNWRRSCSRSPARSSSLVRSNGVSAERGRDDKEDKASTRSENSDDDAWRDNRTRSREYPAKSKGKSFGRGGKGKSKGATGPRVYVGNLHYKVSWQTLKDHMRQAGNVVI